MPELRRDPIVGRWVIIATERARRPSHFQRRQEPPEGGLCPFCPGHEDKTPHEVYVAGRSPAAPVNSSGWGVRVVPNRFPALMIEGDLDRQGEGIYDRMNGVGAHEVIIETPDHGRDLGELSGVVLGANGLSKTLIGFFAAKAVSKFAVDQTVTRILALFLFTVGDGLLVTILSLMVGPAASATYSSALGGLLLSATFNTLLGLVWFGYHDRSSNVTA